jgi:hypothetical protein
LSRPIRLYKKKPTRAFSFSPIHAIHRAHLTQYTWPSYCYACWTSTQITKVLVSSFCVLLLLHPSTTGIFSSDPLLQAVKVYSILPLVWQSQFKNHKTQQVKLQLNFRSLISCYTSRSVLGYYKLLCNYRPM